MIRLSRRAQGQLRELIGHYRKLDRGQAVMNLQDAIRQARRTLEAGDGRLRSYPATFVGVARPGTGWLRSGRYWIAVQLGPDPMITAVYWDAAAIDRRHSEPE